MNNSQKVAEVQRVCDQRAALYACSGGMKGIVPLLYQPQVDENSEHIFAALVRSWYAVDRPNALLQLPDSTRARGAVRRSKHADMRVVITHG